MRASHLCWSSALSTLLLIIGLAIPDSAFSLANQSISAKDNAVGRMPCSARFRKTKASVANFHNPNLVSITDTEICLEGYVSDFDGDDDDDGDGKADRLGVPHFVVQRVDRAESSPESRERPTRWMTIPSLADRDLAPTHDSYVYSKAFRAKHPNWYERGHLAQKYLLERLGKDAGWNSHNVINAVPQRGQFNKTAWLDLECRTGAWANEFGTVWVISGPVFRKDRPRTWLLEKGRPAMAVAIPDEMFKVVIRKVGDRFEMLAFVLPQEDARYDDEWDLSDWLISVAKVEALTGLQFFPADNTLNASKKKTAANLWPVRQKDFDTGCRNFALEDQ